MPILLTHHFCAVAHRRHGSPQEPGPEGVGKRSADLPYQALKFFTTFWEHFTIHPIGSYSVQLCGSYREERSVNSGIVIQKPSNR